MPKDEADGFAEFYESNVDALYAYALCRTSHDLALEAVEETFLVAWRRFAELPAEPRPWLFGVARKVLSHQRRTTSRQNALALRAVTASGLGLVPDHAEQIVENDRVLGALARLSAPDRELLCLSGWGRLSPAELAQVLECTKATLAVRLHRARKRFEAAIEAEDGRAEEHPTNNSNLAPPEVGGVKAEGGDCRFPATITSLCSPALPTTFPKEALP